MRSEAHDRRILRTRKTLHEALLTLIIEKGFEAVSVQDVIQRANVGRSTFYSHFKDTEDLFLSGFENLWSLFDQHLTEQAAQKATVWDLSLIVFQHAQEYGEVYRALVGRRGEKLMSAHLYKYLSAIMKDALKAEWTTEKLVPLEVVVHHLVSSLVALLIWWVNHDLSDPPRHMNEMYKLLTQPAIEKL